MRLTIELTEESFEALKAAIGAELVQGCSDIAAEPVVEVEPVVESSGPSLKHTQEIIQAYCQTGDNLREVRRWLAERNGNKEGLTVSDLDENGRAELLAHIGAS